MTAVVVQLLLEVLAFAARQRAVVGAAIHALLGANTRVVGSQVGRLAFGQLTVLHALMDPVVLVFEALVDAGRVVVRRSCAGA